MENGANIGRINELALLERLFNEHLDGIFLIEYPSGNIIKLSDNIAGNFTNVLKFDGTPYDEQINDLIDATAPDVDKDSIKHSMALSTIVDNLEKEKCTPLISIRLIQTTTTFSEEYLMNILTKKRYNCCFGRKYFVACNGENGPFDRRI